MGIITNGMRKNDFIRYFWLEMRNLMTKKHTMPRKVWYNIYIFKGKMLNYSAI